MKIIRDYSPMGVTLQECIDTLAGVLTSDYSLTDESGRLITGHDCKVSGILYMKGARDNVAVTFEIDHGNKLFTIDSPDALSVAAALPIF